MRGYAMHCIIQADKEFSHIGHYIATLLPRTADGRVAVRQTAGAFT